MYPIRLSLTVFLLLAVLKTNDVMKCNGQQISHYALQIMCVCVCVLLLIMLTFLLEQPSLSASASAPPLCPFGCPLARVCVKDDDALRPSNDQRRSRATREAAAGTTPATVTVGALVLWQFASWLIGADMKTFIGGGARYELSQLGILERALLV